MAPTPRPNVKSERFSQSRGFEEALTRLASCVDGLEQARTDNYKTHFGQEKKKKRKKRKIKKKEAEKPIITPRWLKSKCRVS